MGDLIAAGRSLGDGAAVDHDGLRTQTAGAADCVHGHVTAADHQDALGVLDALRQVGTVEVDLGQVVVGRPHTLQGGVQATGGLGHIGAVADEDGVIASGEQVVHALVLVDGAAGADLHTAGLQGLDLPVHHAVGQDELGDAVGQDAAHIGQLLEHGHVITQQSQVPGAGDAGRAGTDDGDFLALLLHNGGVHAVAGCVPVSDEALQAADAHGLTAHRMGAVLFALLLLGADTAADGRHGASHGDDVIGGLEITLSDLGNELRDALMDGAAGGAGLLAAVQAPHGLADGVGLGITQCHFIEVGATDLAGLLRHGISFSYVVNHFASPSFGSRLFRFWIRLS